MDHKVAQGYAHGVMHGEFLDVAPAVDKADNLIMGIHTVNNISRFECNGILVPAHQSGIGNRRDRVMALDRDG